MLRSLDRVADPARTSERDAHCYPPSGACDMMVVKVFIRNANSDCCASRRNYSVTKKGGYFVLHVGEHTVQARVEKF